MSANSQEEKSAGDPICIGRGGKLGRARAAGLTRPDKSLRGAHECRHRGCELTAWHADQGDCAFDYGLDKRSLQQLRQSNRVLGHKREADVRQDHKADIECPLSPS